MGLYRAATGPAAALDQHWKYASRVCWRRLAAGWRRGRQLVSIYQRRVDRRGRAKNNVAVCCRLSHYRPAGGGGPTGVFDCRRRERSRSGARRRKRVVAIRFRLAGCRHAGSDRRSGFRGLSGRCSVRPRCGDGRVGLVPAASSRVTAVADRRRRPPVRRRIGQKPLDCAGRGHRGTALGLPAGRLGNRAPGHS